MKKESKATSLKPVLFNRQKRLIAVFVFFWMLIILPVSLINNQAYAAKPLRDCLFTSEEKISREPDEVKLFLKASLKGWDYAMTHTQEIIYLILSKYNGEFPRDVLDYEAKIIEKLMQPKLIKIGHTNPGRWKHIVDTYVRLKMVAADYSLDGFIYDPNHESDCTKTANIVRMLVALAFFISLFSLTLLFFNRKLNKKVVERTKHLSQEIADREKTQERLNLAFNAANDGLWDINLQTKETYYSPNYFRMIGYEPGYFSNDSDFGKKSCILKIISRLKGFFLIILKVGLIILPQNSGFIQNKVAINGS